jgi:succinylarginine dihydrolase
MKNHHIKEVVFIGLSGLTHHYGGLSPDNIASDLNRGHESNPRQSALQVLVLARHLRSLGVIVGVLPPQLRPYMPILQENGFNLETAPLGELEKASSSSFMWAANAATVTSSYDSDDKKLHLTTANLHSNPHRRIEARATHHILSQIFANVQDTIIHPPLEFSEGFLDEGAANHLRLSPRHGALGLNVFVYGKRQNKQASEKIARTHHIPPVQTLLLRQNQEVIDKGVFHNDVIAVSNENLLLVHSRAYENGLADIERIETAYKNLHPQDNLQLIVISDDDLSVEEAVHSYFFNSQIVTKENGKMAVIAPLEMQTLYGGKAANLMKKICASADNSIDEVQYLDLRQSMRNGGGPACLRLRIPMTQKQIDELAEYTGILINEKNLAAIENLIKLYYPERLTPEGLRNPELHNKGKMLLAEMEQLLLINILD